MRESKKLRDFLRDARKFFSFVVGFEIFASFVFFFSSFVSVLHHQKVTTVGKKRHKNNLSFHV